MNRFTLVQTDGSWSIRDTKYGKDVIKEESYGVASRIHDCLLGSIPDSLLPEAAEVADSYIKQNP